MFKTKLELPTIVVKETAPASKKKKKSKPVEKLGANDLQKMMDELKSAEKPEHSVSDKKQMKPQKDIESTQEPAHAKTETERPVKKDKKLKPEQKKKNGNSSKELETKPEPKPEPKSEQAGTKRKAAVAEESAAPAKKLTPLQLKMQQKLSGARFRWINEQLYTTSSEHAFDIFQKQPEFFKEYHDGFRHQVESWPENPVISFVEQFKDRLVKPLCAPGGLPGDKIKREVVVADMGCGEAELALRLSENNLDRRRTQFKVHSFDMNAANDRITVADIANVPLPDESCHVVVFCLALMGTNLADFINEGVRILKPNGLVWIAEIKSRFEDDDYSGFVETLKSMGLYHKTTDDSNKMFVKFEFIKLPHKLARAKDTHPDIHLKPCIYKRR